MEGFGRNGHTIADSSAPIIEPETLDEPAPTHPRTRRIRDNGSCIGVPLYIPILPLAVGIQGLTQPELHTT